MNEARSTGGQVYCFCDCKLIPDRRSLLHGDVPLQIGTRAFDILHLLVARSGEVVPKEDLLRFAWPHTTVEASNLKVNISTLRRILPRRPSEPPCIATVPGQGYRFVAPLRTYGDLSQAANLPVSTAMGQMPVIPPIIGRDGIVEQLQARLRQTGHVTIVGAAGVGKTTIAIAAAQRWASDYADGVCFVDLASIADPELVHPAVALALGVNFNVTNRLAGIVDALRDRHMLLLLDNCEHLLGMTSALIEHLRLTAPGVHVVATSREPLRSRTEALYRLSPLECPDAEDAVDAVSAETFSAVALFVARAREVQGYQFHDDDAPIVAAICRRLDGIALAIELAVSNLPRHDPAALLKQLEHSFDLPGSPARMVHFRHQTLLATLDWSYRLLSMDEARLLRRLSVFASSFTMEDVIGVYGDLGSAEDAVTGTQALVAKSLLSLMHDSDRIRYRLLDSTKRFAGDRLRATDEHLAAMTACARHFLDMFERAEAEWQWRARTDWIASYAHYASDLRNVIQWSLDEGHDLDTGIRLTCAAIPFWDELSAVSESRERVERALRQADALSRCDPSLKLKLFTSYATSLNFSDLLGAEADAAWSEGFRSACETGNLEYQLRTLWGLAVLQTFSGRHRAAIATIERFEVIAQRGNERSVTLDGERLKSSTDFYRGEILSSHNALSVLMEEHSHAVSEPRVSRFHVDRYVLLRVSFAMSLWMRGEQGRAMAVLDEALDRSMRLDHLATYSNALAQAGVPLALQCGMNDLALSRLETLTRNLTLREIPIWRPVRNFFDGILLCENRDESGIEIVRSAIDELVANNFLIRLPMYLTMSAEAALRFGRLDLACIDIDRAFETSEAQDERWYLPETMRVQAILQLQRGERAIAEASLARAADTARRSGATSFRLRATTDLAAIWVMQKRPQDAAALLQPVYDEFDANCTSRDAIRARSLLADIRRLPEIRREKS